MRRRDVERVGHRLDGLAFEVDTRQHGALFLGQAVHRGVQAAGELVRLRRFGHGERGRVGKAFLQRIATRLGLRIHARNVRSAFLPQEVGHAAADAMHGEQAERDAPRRVIALDGFDEADGALLDDIHDAGQRAVRHGLLEDERLVRFDDPAARNHVAARLIRPPERCLLVGLQELDALQFFHVIFKTHACAPPFAPNSLHVAD